jgi:hypothetical protein
MAGQEPNTLLTEIGLGNGPRRFLFAAPASGGCESADGGEESYAGEVAERFADGLATKPDSAGPRDGQPPSPFLAAAAWYAA